MTEWQPIETAPEDETPHLILDRSGRMYVGYWSERTFMGGGWTTGLSFDDFTDHEIYNPTHWMPLPDPPCDSGSHAEHRDTK